MERNSCIFYKSFYDSIKELDPKDQVQIYNAIFKYQFGNELVDLKGVCKSIFTLIIPQLEANNKRYENGTKGGRPKTKQKPKENQKETKIEPNENVNENDNENNNDNYKENISKEKKFKKPTLEEIEQYCKERNNNVNAKKFFDYYEANNWKDKDNKQIKNWKQKVITWEGRKNNKQEEDMPSWYGKDIQKSELTSKEQQEIDDLINNF